MTHVASTAIGFELRDNPQPWRMRSNASATSKKLVSEPGAEYVIPGRGFGRLELGVVGNS